MPWNGLGLYTLPPAYSPEVNGTIIDAVRYNGLTSDVATGITNALAKDGQNVPTANISWGGFRLTNLAQAISAGDALAWGQNASVANLTVSGTMSLPAFSGVIVAPLGAVGAPSYTFTGDLNNGMWSPGADIIAWSTAGVERSRIGATGTHDFLGNALLGVGNIGGNADNSAWSLWGGRTTSNGGYISLYGGSNATPNIVIIGRSSTESLRISAVGDVGINGPGNAYGANILATTINGPLVSVLDLNTGGTRIATFNANSSAGQVVLGGVTNLPVLFFQNNIERARLSASNGNLLVGRTTDTGGSQLLQVGSNSITARAAFYSNDVYAVNIYGGNGAFLLGASNNANPDLLFSNASAVERFRIFNDGRIGGPALHNNAGSVTGTNPQYIASGTYTPTATAVTNCTAPAGQKCQWIRVGNVVTVSGSCSLDVTAGGAAATRIDVSLPIASNLAALSDLGGGFQCNIGVVAGGSRLDADTVNDRARLIFTSSTTGAATLSFIFSYEIL